MYLGNKFLTLHTINGIWAIISRSVQSSYLARSYFSEPLTDTMGRVGQGVLWTFSNSKKYLKGSEARDESRW